MVTTPSFYTIPESEILYYTMGQPSIQSHMIHPKQYTANNTTSFLSLPLPNGPQGRNTHTTCSENSDQQHVNMVPLILSLQFIAHNPRFSDMKGSFGSIWFR